MKRLPVSLGFIPATLLIYVLACIPGVNFVILFVLMPWWPIVIVNGGMIGLVGEVLVRRLSLFWLLLPTLWFGGYEAWARSDHQALAALRAEVRAANAAVKVPFEPQRHSLVYGTGQPDESLIQNYGLPVLYASDGGKAGGFRSTRMVSNEICRTLRDLEYSSAGIYPHWFHEESDVIAGGAFEKRFCMVSMPESPANPRLTLNVSERTARYRGLPVTYLDTTIATPQGNQFALRDGRASPLHWLPLIAIEYNPTSSNSTPHFTFLRSHFQPLNTEAGRFSSGTATLARVLGLGRIAPADRKAQPSAAIGALIDASQSAIVREETFKLDTVLADVQSEVGSLPFRSLRSRLDIIVPRLDRIMAAIERGVAEQKNGRNNAQQLFHLLEQAPAGKIEPLLGRIEALQTQDNWFKFDPAG